MHRELKPIKPPSTRSELRCQPANRLDRDSGPFVADLFGLPGGMNGRRCPMPAGPRSPVSNVLFITGHAENAAVDNGSLDPGMPMFAKPFACQTVRAGSVCQREMITGP
jgi:hypothetical protein